MASYQTNIDGDIQYTSEYNDFIAKLTKFHEERGTRQSFDPEPRVGVKHLNLLELYNLIIDRGGYDKVTDTKLLWRKLGQELNLGMSNLPAQAFTLKTAYYKNLAAYEIKTFWKQDPPPKEILEDQTAKGGHLLSRTLENFKGNKRDQNSFMNDEDASNDDGTPAREHGGVEDTPGSGRATRGLRQAPPQRQLFQPPPTATTPRQHRQTSAAVASPQPPRGASAAYFPTNPDNLSSTVSQYEPKPQLALSLRRVMTPGNDPVEFAKRAKYNKELGNKIFVPPRIMLPGTGFEGPNIYQRCLMALKSGIQSEQNYALHHLVKISMERGDKYKFESFAGLAEALIEKALEVSTLFYDVTWEVSYDDDAVKDKWTLDGLEGTPDILERIKSLTLRTNVSTIQPESFSDTLLEVNQAALALRNMAMLEENAYYICKLHPLRDLICIALSLPNVDTVVELKHYCLDIAEQITKYLHLDHDDPLYITLLAQLNSDDRGAILTALRAISSISMNLEEPNHLRNIQAPTLQRIMDWTLLEDDELALACLDFFYQYTAIIANVDNLLSALDLHALISRCSQLLSHGAATVVQEFVVKHAVRHPAPSQLPAVPDELLTQLLGFDEPERSSHWLRSLFEEDKDESITQIELWQAYQARFSSHQQETGRALLPAADFIKNVSTTFAEKASAQVVAGPAQKFIIKGIRMREKPVDLNGVEYVKCLWQESVAEEGIPAVKDCGQFFMGAENLYNHIMVAHVKASQTGDGKFENTTAPRTCAWKGCTKYNSSASMPLKVFGSHLKIHLPKSAPLAVRSPGAESPIDSSSPPLAKKARKDPDWLEPAQTDTWSFIQGQVDERGDAAGIPLSAVLVLRNLARNLPKTESEEILKGESRSRNGDDNEHQVAFVGYRERMFKSQEPALWAVFAENKSLRNYLGDLLPMIAGARR